MDQVFLKFLYFLPVIFFIVGQLLFFITILYFTINIAIYF